MSDDTRIVETDHGLEVRKSYEKGCEEYTFGVAVALGLGGLFVSIFHVDPAFAEYHHLTRVLGSLFLLGCLGTLILKRVAPIRFYEFLEGEPGSDRGEEVFES